MAGPISGPTVNALGSNRRRITVGLRLSTAALLSCAGVGATALASGPPRPGNAEVELMSGATALIMAGTDMHVVDQPWMDLAIHNYIEPTLGGRYTPTPVVTPAEFWPFGGPDDMLFDLSVLDGTQRIGSAIAAQTANNDGESPTVVFGYSQSAVIATAAKRQLADAGADPSAVSFVMLANLNRPNGGINSRFPGAFIEELGWTFSPAAPTDTAFATVDVARQYDLFADFPRYPLNLFATANALLAVLYGSHDYTGVTLNPEDPGYNPNTVVQQQGDTTYYFIPSETLPLLRPLRDLGVDPVLLDAAEPVLRLLVEFGYDRTTPFGQPAPAVLTERADFDQLSADVAAAVEQGQAMLAAADPGPAAAPSAVKPLERSVAQPKESTDPGIGAPTAAAAPTTVTEPRRASRISPASAPTSMAETGRVRPPSRAGSGPESSTSSRSRR